VVKAGQVGDPEGTEMVAIDMAGGDRRQDGDADGAGDLAAHVDQPGEQARLVPRHPGRDQHHDRIDGWRKYR
jgi:hypothetical protein